MIAKQELNIVVNGHGNDDMGHSSDQDIDKILEDSEDVIRNEIYKKIERDLFDDDYDCGTLIEISEFLQLTNDPLCREIGMSIATLGDRFVEYVEVQKRLRQIADDISRHYTIQHEDLIWYNTDHTRIEIFRRVASRITADGVNWERIAALLYFAFRLILRPVSLRLETCMRRMDRINVPGIYRKNDTSRVSQRESSRPSSNYRSRRLVRIGYITLPVIGVLATIAYFKS